MAAAPVIVHIKVSALHVTCRSCGQTAALSSSTGQLVTWAQAHQQPWLEGLTSRFNDSAPVYQAMRRPRLLR